MRQAGLSGLISKKRGRTTIRVPGVRVADDLVERQFTAPAPNVLWIADVTYLRTWEGWLYLAAVQDAFSRLIVGWQMADHMQAELVVDALKMAINLPLEGRQARRWLGRQPLPRDSALRLVHGQRAGDALRGCRHRSRPPGRREPRPTPLRPPRQGLRTRPDCRRIRHTRREPSQAPRIINATPTQESLC
jgi:transposase InsO family protein